MTPSITICRIAGIKIGLNWSWLVVFALIVWSLATAVFPTENPGLSDAAYGGMAVAAALLFFTSLLLHELGHALRAKREGMEIDSITLWLFGGVARFKGMFPSAGAEFRIAIAGPLVSAALGGLFVAIAAAIGSPRAIDGVAAWLGYINLILAVFNMLPALPLDGGRVLRSALWRAKADFEWATRIAADVGRGFGYLFIGGGLAMLVFLNSWSGAWLAFLGWFLLMAAASEARYVIARAALSGLRVRDLMVRQPVTVRASETLGQFMDDVVHSHRYTTYPVTENGSVVGLLPFSRLAAVPRAEWETRLVRESMLPRGDVAVLREDEELIDALADLSEARSHRGLVLEGERLVGFLSISDLVRLLQPSGRL